MPLPKVITNGKRLEGFRLEELADGQVRVHYGRLYGWALFPSMKAAKDDVLPWLARREALAQKALDEISATRKTLARLT